MKNTDNQVENMSCAWLGWKLNETPEVLTFIGTFITSVEDDISKYRTVVQRISREPSLATTIYSVTDDLSIIQQLPSTPIRLFVREPGNSTVILMPQHSSTVLNLATSRMTAMQKYNANLPNILNAINATICAP